MLGTYHLNVLYDILKDIHFLYQTDRIYEYLLQNLMKVLDADAASLFVMDEKKENLVLRACLGPKKNVLEIISQEIPFPVGKGVCGWTAQFNQSIVIDDVTRDQRFSGQFDTLTGYKTKSVLCAPLASKDSVLGVIEILNKRSSVFNKNDLDLVTLIARQTAVALQNANLYDALARAKNFNDSIINSLTGGFIAMDDRAIISHLNSAAASILAIVPQDAIGRPAAEVLKYYPDFHRELEQTLRSKTRKLRQEFSLLRADAQVQRIGYSTFLIENPQQEVQGSAIIFQDLTRI